MPNETDFGIPALPELPDSCPMSELIGKRVTQMTDAELEVHLMGLRSAVEAPQSLRRMLVSGKAKASKEKKPAAKVNLDLLGL